MNRVGKIVPPKREISRTSACPSFPRQDCVLGLNAPSRVHAAEDHAGLDKDIL